MIKIWWIPFGLVLVAIAGIVILRSGGATAQEGSCDKALSSRHYDLLTRLDIPDRWSFSSPPYPRIVKEYKTRVSGGDYHLTTFLDDLYTEHMYVEGKGYVRHSEHQGEGKWERSDQTTAAWVGNFMGLGALSDGSVVCPDIPKRFKIGEEVLNGVTMTRYQGGFEIDLLAASPENLDPFIRVDTYDYWVDPTGLLVQAKHVHTYPPDEGETDRVVYKEVTIISGVGEVNTITAPQVP